MSNVAVYAKGSTDFITQGLGILSDVESSQTTQTVSDGGNVTSQLELEYPVKGRLVDKLVEGNFIRVSMATDSSKYMVYEISDTLKDDSGTITIYADPYSDRIGRMSFENGGKFGSYNSVQAALTYAKSQMKDFPSSFQLTSNISKSVDFTKDGIIPNFKKFLDLLNTKVSGNVYYGLNVIQIYSALGKDRSDIILRDDRNTSSVKVKTDYSSIINRIIPVLPVKDKDGNATQETKVGTPVISKTPNQFIDYWSAEVVQLDTQDLANTYFDRTHADRPIQTVDVDPLSMSEDFSDIDIFDRVQIYSSRLNYTDKLRVSSRVVDNLTGQVIKFSLGNASVSIYNTIEGQTQSVLNQIQAITSVVISASGKNQIYTSNIQPTSANEGDMWIQEDGDYQAFWVFKNGDWVRLVDSNTQKDITDGVNNAIEQAKLDAQALVNSNNTAIRSEMQTVATQKAQDEIAKGNFDSNAQAYANSAKSAAIAQAQSLVSTASTDWSNQLEDAKTDYTQKYSDVKTTADGITANFNSYKKSNDQTLVSYKSLIDANSQAITLAATKTELNTAKSDFSSQVASVKADYNSVTQSVTELTGKFNDLGQSNLLLNTEWTPDASSWFGWSNIGANGLDQCVSIVTGQYKGSNGLLYDTTSQTSKYYARTQQDIPVNGQQVLSISWVSKVISIAPDMYANLWINFLDANRNPIGDAVFGSFGRPTDGNDWVYKKLENIQIPDGTVIVKPSFESREGVKIILSQPMFTFSDHIGSYSQGNYSNNDKIALQQITINSISDIVSNPTTGLSTRVQTAEGFLTQVRGTDIPALQKATFWQPYSSLDFNDYTEQGSFFFNSASAKTNGPTTNNNYIYLVVEQGLPTSNSKGGRIKQTAWYDGVTGVKTTYVRTLNNTTWSDWYANDNDSVATISVMNGQIAQEVSDRKSGDTNTLTQANSYTQAQISSATSGLNTTITQTANGIMAMTSTTNLVVDSSLINSALQSSIDSTWTVDTDGAKTWYYSSGVSYMGVQAFGFNISDNSTGYRYRATSQPWNTSSFAGSTLYASVDVRINSIGGTSTDYLNVYLVELDSSGNQTQATSITGGLKTTSGWTNYRQKIIINSATRKMYIQYSMRGNGNGYVARPYVGNLELPEGGYTPGPIQSTSTIISLMKDNWSIGIADNIGNIVSGIAGNSAQMAIISDKVIIKSPNTQITGTAWINSAMIANGAIGTAQIGDASITSAKILSIDVGKISGNISNFIQSYWNGVYGSTTMNSNGLSVQSGSMTTRFDSSGAHFVQGNRTAQYAFGNWRDNTGSLTSAIGLYIGLQGDSNSFLNIVGPSGAASVVIAGSSMADGVNSNIVRDAINLYPNTNIRSRLLFKGNQSVQSTYIEANEVRRTLNFYTSNAKNGDGNWFWFNQKVLSEGTFSSTSLLSKKDIQSTYDEDALDEILKTQLVRFKYKNNPGDVQISPIIDDINTTKKYYIPDTILGQDGKYVDMYSMITMAWKAIQQLALKDQ